jgi:alpha/beta superfamily hydrolase
MALASEDTMDTAAGPAAVTSEPAAERSRFGETNLVRLLLGVVAVHVVDDNFLQPPPGTSAVGHLVSGLVPLAVLAAVAAVYPRLRAGGRATLAMTFGALGILIGVPSAHHLLAGNLAGNPAGPVPGDVYTGLLAGVAGMVLFASGPVVLWRSRRADGRRWLRRTVKALGSVVLGVALLWFVVFPIGFAYGYTHIGGIGSTTDVGLAAEQVMVTTEDSLDLAAWYIPSRNRAAVILHPGSTRTDEARMLARHGYGVLLLDGRGQGTSEGDAVRWAGDRDLLAGADFLRDRPDVDPHRIGAIGFSVGGEVLLEAAAQSTTIRAVVSEGAGTRVGEADVTGPAQYLVAPNQAILTAATAVFANHLPPPPIVERIGQIAPRPLLLIYAEPGMGQEDTRQPTYYDAAGTPKQLWRVPGAAHTGGLSAAPAAYETRVVGFLDQALLED